MTYKYQDGVQVLSSNRFDMTFSARAIGVITVQPSAIWFDTNTALKYKQELKNNGVQLIPNNLFVAMNPRVKITGFLNSISIIFLLKID